MKDWRTLRAEVERRTKRRLTEFEVEALWQRTRGDTEWINALVIDHFVHHHNAPFAAYGVPVLNG